MLVMLAGPGYGKTQAMAAYLDQSDANILWLRLKSLDNLHTHFWDHLAHALEREFGDAAEHLRTLEFPDTLSKFDVFQNVLTKELRGAQQMIWVFDDFGEIADEKIIDFFRMLVEVEIENLHVVLISNALSRSEPIAYMTDKRDLILGRDLKFTEDEIVGLYGMYGIPLESDEISGLERQTEGWPLPLHLLAMQRDRASVLAACESRVAQGKIRHMFQKRFFSAYSARFQNLLIRLSLLTSFTGQIVRCLYEGDRADLDVLYKHVFVAREPATGFLSFHHMYRLFLQEKQHLLSDEEIAHVWKKAAEYYESSGNAMEAAACYRKCGDHEGMLRVISDFLKQQHSITEKDATFLLEHIDALSDDEERKNPLADFLRAFIYTKAVDPDRCEAIISDLEKRLLRDDTPEAKALLGETYFLFGVIHMMRNREDFGDYFKKSAEYLPEGSRIQNRAQLFSRNNHNFSMADNRPGAKERMERAAHYGVPWMSKILRGGLGGMEHIFSAESAYLSCNLEEARQHAYRAIYKAEANAQHDLVCNGYLLLARVGALRGDFSEMTRQIQSVADYAAQHKIGVLNEIRDTALGWYYIVLRDNKRIPRSILTLNNSDRPVLTHGRLQIVYAAYLIQAGEYARLAGMLEHPKGLFLTSGIWPDRISLNIMLAIAYHYLGNPDAAMRALWTAYDMSYENGLTALFIEAGEHTRLLIEVAASQRTYEFAPEWLDLIRREAVEYAKRADAVRADYRKLNPPHRAGDNPLTGREMKILYLLSQGMTREEIAVESFISVNTVKTFIRSIYNKLDATNRAQAVSIAISRGYLDVS